MAGSVGPTPRVFFTLDDSETTRLTKLRENLKLAHWSSILERYELQANEAVAKSINSLRVNDSVAYGNLYAPWHNRYSDFKLTWTKAKDPVSNEIKGHLMATGVPRIKNLGKIGEGCSVSLMSGSMLQDPLPTTSVGDLRIGHLEMEIQFKEKLQFEKDTFKQDESKNYEVGYQNQLYGLDLIERNKAKYKEDQAAKKGPSTEAFLSALMKGLNVMNKKERTSGGEDENISDIEDSDAARRGAFPSPSSSKKKTSFRPTPEMNSHTEHVRDHVGPNSTKAKDVQPQDGAAAGHNVVPDRDNDVDNQVSLRFL